MGSDTAVLQAENIRLERGKENEFKARRERTTKRVWKLDLDRKTICCDTEKKTGLLQQCLGLMVETEARG